MTAKRKPQLKTRCCTDRPTSSVCTDCGRVLCAWHSAGSPVQMEGAIVLAPICYPSCEYTRRRVVRRGMGYASSEIAAAANEEYRKGRYHPEKGGPALAALNKHRRNGKP